MRTLDFNQMELIEGGIKWKCIFSIALIAVGAAAAVTGVGAVAGGAAVGAGAAGVISQC